MSILAPEQISSTPKWVLPVEISTKNFILRNLSVWATFHPLTTTPSLPFPWSYGKALGGDFEAQNRSIRAPISPGRFILVLESPLLVVRSCASVQMKALSLYFRSIKTKYAYDTHVSRNFDFSYRINNWSITISAPAGFRPGEAFKTEIWQNPLQYPEKPPKSTLESNMGLWGPK